MHIPRIYQPIPLINHTQIFLDTWGVQHIKALRLRENDVVILFNGEGKDYQGKIIELTHKSVSINLLSEQKVIPESILNTHLLQAISRGERMDYTIQKVTELGITSIIPILSERCEVKLSDERWQKKQQHWQNIVISACEQSGRSFIPKIYYPQTLSTSLEKTDGLKIILDPYASKTLSDLDNHQSPTDQAIYMLIGPEGGFTTTETQQAQQKGFQGLRLGNRILRTETAAPALLAALHAKWGDFL